MFHILTTSELAEILECSPKTARERAKKEGFENVTKEVDGREYPAFKINNNKLEELKLKVQKAKEKHSGNSKVYQEDNNYVSYTVSEPYVEHSESNNGKAYNQFDKFLDYLKEKDKREQEKDLLVKEYVDRVINAEKQVKLLEDSENRSKDEYLKQLSELKTSQLSNRRNSIILISLCLVMFVAFCSSIVYFKTRPEPKPAVIIKQIKVPVIKYLPASVRKR